MSDRITEAHQEARILASLTSPEGREPGLLTWGIATAGSMDRIADIADRPPRMSEAEFAELLNLLMCSDPAPCEIGHLKSYADQLAKSRGHHDWVDAYHKVGG